MEIDREEARDVTKNNVKEVIEKEVKENTRMEVEEIAKDVVGELIEMLFKETTKDTTIMLVGEIAKDTIKEGVKKIIKETNVLEDVKNEVQGGEAWIPKEGVLFLKHLFRNLSPILVVAFIGMESVLNKVVWTTFKFDVKPKFDATPIKQTL